MTVKELITRLLDADPQANVATWQPGGVVVDVVLTQPHDPPGQEQVYLIVEVAG